MKRCECVVFDEGGWLSEEDFGVIGAFAVQNANFKLGGNVNNKVLPSEFPHQLLYASSASSVDTAFYAKYRDFSKQMIAGNPNYFVADINCDIVIHTTFRGKPIDPLLTKETVDTEMRNNPEKALREYYNIFSKDGGVGQIIPRNIIARNSFNRPPVMNNTNNKRKFVIAHDPAHNRDNSIVAIGELLFDEETGYTMDVVNVVNMVDPLTKKRKPLTHQNQLEIVKQLIVDYNGQVPDWENIEAVMIDAGSGGAGNLYPSFLIEGWEDKHHERHRGLLDPEYNPEYINKYPEAVRGVLMMLEPTKYKSLMYEAAIQMTHGNYIHFPERYDNKGYLNLFQADKKKIEAAQTKIRAELQELKLEGKAYEEEYTNRMSMVDCGKTKIYRLSPDEEIALKQIDAMKEEIVNICRIESEGSKDKFKLPTHKDADNAAQKTEAQLHDDRAYCLAMLCYYLSEKRLDHIKNKKSPKADKTLVEKLEFKKPVRRGII